MVRWISGAILGTTIFLSASPLFTRSYLPNQTNRGIATLPSGYVYRWRSEGYADTSIGPGGMPGKMVIRPRSDNIRRVALWGDSQAEGVAVRDDQKLFSAIDRSIPNFETFPFAISGDSLGDWIAQMKTVEDEFGIDRHLILICELSDLLDTTPPTPPTVGRFGGVTAMLPAALVTAVRNVVTGADGKKRTLRFSVGPDRAPATVSRVASEPNFAVPLQQLRAATARPIDILYAPLVPQLIGGKFQRDDPQGELAEQVAAVAIENDVAWIDATLALQTCRPYPHGFQNGTPAAGHLNAHGYQTLASVFAGSRISD